jgi:hypothetical protein
MIDTSELMSEDNKIALCIPNRSGTEITLEWAMFFRKLILPTDSQIFVHSRGTVDVARNLLVKKALDLGFDYIGFLDSDVKCPEDAFIRMLAHKKPFMSGLYRAKKNVEIDGKKMWNAFVYDSEQDGYTPIVGWKGDGILTADIVGAGLMLIDLDVIGHGMSEDFDFCVKMKGVGIPCLVDSTIQATHICGEMKILPDGTVTLLEI